jgi:hypothetical protein
MEYHTRLSFPYKTSESMHHLKPFVKGFLIVPPCLPKPVTRQVPENEKRRWQRQGIFRHGSV